MENSEYLVASKLIDKLKDRVGESTATVVFSKDASDRYLIADITLTAVAIYLLSRYIDGFVDGLGINSVGERHGKLSKITLTEVIERIKSNNNDLMKLISNQRQALLLPYSDRAQAKITAEESVFQILTQHGIPEFEANRIAQEITEELFANE